jgi:hypothetical protein
MNTNILGKISTLNDIAELSGLLNWEINDAKFKNPDGSIVSFYVLNRVKYPIARYLNGGINAFNLVNGLFFNKNQKDPNQTLFNTNLGVSMIKESCKRKYSIREVPYANYDQLVNLGMSGQLITFKVVFAGTQYLTAYLNVIQNLFGYSSSNNDLGTLYHPFYNEIKGVLPLAWSNEFVYDTLNFVAVDITFRTSNILHLSPQSLNQGLREQIALAYIAIENSLLSIGAMVDALKGLSHNIIG